MARISPRYHLVAFAQDLSLFTAWSVIPVWAKIDAGASPLALGALPLFSGLTYVVAAPLAGRLSDRISRTALVRIGLVLYAAFCLLAWRATSIGWIYLVAPLGGLGNALVWPAIQAKIGDESGAHDLERNLGAFSLSWSAGKTLGFFLGGPAYAEFGLGALPLCALLSAGLAALAPPRSRRSAAPDEPLVLVEEGGPPAATRNAFLRAAWIAHFAIYGLGATLNFLYEDLVVRLGRDHFHYNVLLGTVFLAQTVAFWAFGRFAGWRYRARAFLSWQAIGAMALVVVGLGAPLPLALLAGVLMGASSGLGYAASIYYSVHSDKARGARAGIHEAILGASNFAIPLLGGAAQRASGFSAAPYAIAAGAVVAGLLAQVLVLRAAAKRPASLPSLASRVLERS